MARGGFWDFENYWSTVTSGSFWFDGEWKQRRDINMLEAVEQANQIDISMLQSALAQAQKQMLELSMSVVVMAQMLQEAGQLDLDKLHARLDAELERIRPKPQPAIDAHPAKARPQDFAVQCAKCGRTVPSSQTTITEAGTHCDTCAG